MNLNFDSHTSNIVYTVKYQVRLELSLKSDIIYQKKHYLKFLCSDTFLLIPRPYYLGIYFSDAFLKLDYSSK